MLLLAVLLLAAVFVVPRRTSAAAWAELHDVRLTTETEPMVAWYLRTASILRRVGVAAGLFLPPIVDAALGDTRPTMSWTWIFAGYLVGAVYAEVALVRRSPDGRRVAALTRRELADYIAPRQLLTQRVLGALLLVAAVAVALVPERMPGPLDRTTTVVVVTAIAAAFAAVLEVVERWLVRRPQPFHDAAFVAADDAIRAHSVRSVAGAGIALLLVALGAACLHLATSDVQVLRWTMWPPAVSAWFLALRSCTQHASVPWRVPPRSAAAPS